MVLERRGSGLSRGARFCDWENARSTGRRQTKATSGSSKREQEYYATGSYTDRSAYHRGTADRSSTPSAGESRFRIESKVFRFQVSRTKLLQIGEVKGRREYRFWLNLPALNWVCSCLEKALGSAATWRQEYSEGNKHLSFSLEHNSSGFFVRILESRIEGGIWVNVPEGSGKFGFRVFLSELRKSELELERDHLGPADCTCFLENRSFEPLQTTFTPSQLLLESDLRVLGITPCLEAAEREKVDRARQLRLKLNSVCIAQPCSCCLSRLVPAAPSCEAPAPPFLQALGVPFGLEDIQLPTPVGAEGRAQQCAVVGQHQSPSGSSQQPSSQQPAATLKAMADLHLEQNRGLGQPLQCAAQTIRLGNHEEQLGLRESTQAKTTDSGGVLQEVIYEEDGLLFVKTVKSVSPEQRQQGSRAGAGDGCAAADRLEDKTNDARGELHEVIYEENGFLFVKSVSKYEHQQQKCSLDLKNGKTGSMLNVDAEPFVPTQPNLLPEFSNEVMTSHSSPRDKGKKELERDVEGTMGKEDEVAFQLTEDLEIAKGGKASKSKKPKQRKKKK